MSAEAEPGMAIERALLPLSSLFLAFRAWNEGICAVFRDSSGSQSLRLLLLVILITIVASMLSSYC